MNAKTIFAAIAMFAASSATFAAGNTEYVDFSNFHSTKTRAEVRAELQDANRDGALARSNQFVEHTAVASTRSRDEVRAEAVKAARSPQKDTSYIGA
jgi:hypothetical protein